MSKAKIILLCIFIIIPVLFMITGGVLLGFRELLMPFNITPISIILLVLGFFTGLLGTMIITIGME